MILVKSKIIDIFDSPKMNTNYLQKTAFALICALLIMASCKHEPEIKPITSNGNGGGNPNNGEPCDSNIVYFNKDVLPILNSNCAMTGCHDAGTASEGIVLSSYSQLMNAAIVVPNNPGNSDLIDVITETRPDKVMPPPPRPKLTAAQVALLTKWINQGAKDVNCQNTGCDSTNVTYANQISSIMTGYCVGCHNNSSAGGNILLTNYNEVKTAIQSKNLLCSVEHTGCSPMPKGGAKLDACKIAQIKKWQNTGFNP